MRAGLTGFALWVALLGLVGCAPSGARSFAAGEADADVSSEEPRASATPSSGPGVAMAPAPAVPGLDPGPPGAPRPDPTPMPSPSAPPPPPPVMPPAPARDASVGSGPADASAPLPVSPDSAPPPPDLAAVPAGFPSNGLVGQWSFDEGSGSRARDSSPNGNHADLMAGAGWGPGRKAGTTAAVLGGSKFVRVPKSASVDSIATGLSIAAWVFHSATTGAALHTVVSRQEGPTNEEIYGLFVKRDGRVVFSMVGTSIESPMPIAANQWVHLTASYDGARARVYVNGAEVAGRNLVEDFGPETEPLVIGGNLNGPQDPSTLSWEGRLDDVLVYNRGLAATEVGALAK